MLMTRHSTLRSTNQLLSYHHLHGNTLYTPWNTHLRELTKHGNYQQCLNLYPQMLRSGATPNAFTFPVLLKSCALLSLPFSGTQLHSHIIKTGCHSEPFVQTALISLYAKCYFMEDARQLFDESPHSQKLTVCYNALVSGYTWNDQFLTGYELFSRMRFMGVHVDAVTMLGLIPGCTELKFAESLHGFVAKCGLDNDFSVANCLLTMYIRCGSKELGRKLFDFMPIKELAAWNAMISGYAQNGYATEALELYHAFESSGLDPDPITLVGVLSSCAHLGAQKIGVELEKKMQSSSLKHNIFLNNALINMYARCGNLRKAHEIFDSMVEKNLVSWTAIIGGYGMHGQGETAVHLFNEMIRANIRPDGPVFVSVLSACSHAGLTDTGLEYFDVMKMKYGLEPGPEHYSCVVDLLGRAGRLDDAQKIIKRMPMEPDGAVWGALLGACKIHKNVDLAEYAFDRVINLEPTNIGYYVLLSNLYTEVNNTEGVLRVRVMMREKRLKKDPGYSYVEHKGKTHLFVAGDRNHPRTDEIYAMLNRLDELINVSSGTMVHSERLAIAFALLITEIGQDILVMKNLRELGKEWNDFLKRKVKHHHLKLLNSLIWIICLHLKLPVELESYIDNVKADARFANLNGLSSLVQLMVETKKHLSFTLVYRLLKLTLVLPVATATVERCFSGMKLVKSDLRNRMGDENLSDSLVCYTEKDLLRNVSVDDVMTRFQKMKTRRERL